MTIKILVSNQDGRSDSRIRVVTEQYRDNIPTPENPTEPGWVTITAYQPVLAPGEEVEMFVYKEQRIVVYEVK